MLDQSVNQGKLFSYEELLQKWTPLRATLVSDNVIPTRNCHHTPTAHPPSFITQQQRHLPRPLQHCQQPHHQPLYQEMPHTNQQLPSHRSLNTQQHLKQGNRSPATIDALANPAEPAATVSTSAASTLISCNHHHHHHRHHHHHHHLCSFFINVLLSKLLCTKIFTGPKPLRKFFERLWT